MGASKHQGAQQTTRQRNSSKGSATRRKASRAGSSSGTLNETASRTDTGTAQGAKRTTAAPKRATSSQRVHGAGSKGQAAGKAAKKASASAKPTPSGSAKRSAGKVAKKASASAKPSARAKAAPSTKSPPQSGSKRGTRAQASSAGAPQSNPEVVERTPARERAGGQLSLQLEPQVREPLGAGNGLPEFRLLDADGEIVTREQLLGQPLVLYFYPKDDTPGCTKEACGFRDEMSRITEAGARVVGVSPDKPATHARFIEKYQLNFRLISDPEHELARHFGVYKLKKNYGREYMGIERSTFLFDAHGSLQREWRAVRVAGHVEDVIAALT